MPLGREGPAGTAQPPCSTTANATVSSLGGTRRGQALLGLQPPVQDQQPVHQLIQGMAGDPRVRMVGGLGEQRVGLGLLLKTHPVRVYSLPLVIPSPCAPAAAAESATAMPEGPPGSARAFGCEVRAGSWIAELAGAPIGQAMGVWSTGCALCLDPPAHAAAPSFHPGPRGAASLGACPRQARHPRPRPPPSWEGPVRGSCPGPGVGKRRAGQVRRSDHLGGSSGHNGYPPRDAIDLQMTDDGGAARWQAATAGGGVGSAPWPG